MVTYVLHKDYKSSYIKLIKNCLSFSVFCCGLLSKFNSQKKDRIKMALVRITLLLTLSVAIPYVLSVTFQGGTANIRPVFKPHLHMEKYCKQYQTDVEWKENETKVEDCFRCTCSSSGLTCNGIGYQAGIPRQNGCTAVYLDKCCYQMVSVENKDVKCGEPVCPENK